MSEYTVTFFDGEKPVPVAGLLTVTDAVLRFDADASGMRYVIKHGDITECVREHGRIIIRAVQKDYAGKIFHRMIIFDDEQLYREVLPRVPRGLFKGHGFRKLASIVIGLGIVFGAIMWGIITQSYRLVPFDAEKKMGEKITQSAFSFAPRYEDALQKKRIEKILARIVPKDSPYTYSVYLLNSSDVNAFAVPGGSVIVFKGMLASGISDNELACVLAHEVSHVEYRHGLRQLIRFAGITYMFHIAGGAGMDQIQGIDAINNITSLLVLFKYSRGFEEEADAHAVQLSRRAGYDPEGLATFLEKMSRTVKGQEPPEYLSTHPATAGRITRIHALIKEKI